MARCQLSAMSHCGRYSRHQAAEEGDGSAAEHADLAVAGIEQRQSSRGQGQVDDGRGRRRVRGSEQGPEHSSSLHATASPTAATLRLSAPSARSRHWERRGRETGLRRSGTDLFTLPPPLRAAKMNVATGGREGLIRTWPTAVHLPYPINIPISV